MKCLQESTLSNGKSFLCVRGGTDNDISIFNGLYQYRNGKIVQVVNFLNTIYGRPVNDAAIYLNGNSVTVRTEEMSYSLGYCTTAYTYNIRMVLWCVHLIMENIPD